MNLRLLFFTGLLLLMKVTFSGNINLDSLSYDEFARVALHLSYTKDYDSTISLLEYARSYYPEKEHEIMANLVIFNLLSGKEERAIELYRQALNKKVFFGFNKEILFSDTIEKREEFLSLLEKDSVLAEEKQKDVKTAYLVDTPLNFNADSLYPLMMVFHDWGQNAEEIREQWRAPLLEERFIRVFVQSPFVADMDGFQWNDTEKSTEEILRVFNEITDFYPVDTSQVITGGYGQGGTIAIHLLLEQLIPAIGFITVCPSIPESFTGKNLQQAKAKKQRAVIVAGVMDPGFSEQTSMIQAFREYAILYRFSPRKTMGREIPKNIEFYIRRGLNYMGYK
jgi:predicted esterase